MDDLQHIAPAPVLVQAGGSSIEIRPLTIGQLPAFAHHVQGIFADVFAVCQDAAPPAAEEVASPPVAEDPASAPEAQEAIALAHLDIALAAAIHPAGAIDWLGLVSEHGESLIEAVAVATRLPRAQVGALPADEFVLLAGAVLEVNADFFLRRLLPMLQQAIGRAVAILDGSMPASASSAPATAGPTS